MNTVTNLMNVKIENNSGDLQLAKKYFKKNYKTLISLQNIGNHTLQNLYTHKDNLEKTWSFYLNKHRFKIFIGELIGAGSLIIFGTAGMIATHSDLFFISVALGG